MKAPITAAQAMAHPDVVLTINTLGQMADELRAERDQQQEALRLALEALESCTPGDYSTGHVIDPWFDENLVADAYNKIKEVLK